MHAFPPDAPEGSTNPHRRLQRVPEQQDLDVDQMSVELADAYNTGLQAFLEHGNEGRGKESEATSLEQFQKCILERREVSKSSKSRKHDNIDD